MGGIIVFVKNTLCKYVTRICATFRFGVILRLDKHLFGSESDYVYCCMYLPPESSPYYKYCSSPTKGVNCLENLLIYFLSNLHPS